MKRLKLLHVESVYATIGVKGKNALVLQTYSCVSSCGLNHFLKSAKSIENSWEFNLNG